MKIDDIINKVHCADCLTFMRDIPDNSADLLYADPPFNTGNKIGWKTRAYDTDCDNMSEEDYQLFCEVWFKEARRIGKKLIITPGVTHIGRYPLPLWTIVIHKPSSPSFHKFGGFNCWEPLLVYDKPVKGQKLPRDVVVFDSQNFFKDGREQHPCPDNLDMVRWIIRTWSNPDDICMDPFLGSGSLAVVCKESGWRFIGIEISQKYVDIANQRLSNTTSCLL